MNKQDFAFGQVLIIRQALANLMILIDATLPQPIGEIVLQCTERNLKQDLIEIAEAGGEDVNLGALECLARLKEKVGHS